MAFLPGWDLFADTLTEITPFDARSASMGFTGVVFQDDPYAIFLNPANLARKQTKTTLQPLNLQLDATQGATSTVTSGRANPYSLSAAYPYMKKNPGLWVGTRAAVYPNFTSRFLSGGLYFQDSASGKYLTQDSSQSNQPTLTQKVFREISPVVGASFRIWGGILKFGYSLRLQTKGTNNKVTVNPDGANLNFRDDHTYASGLVHTAGVTMTLPFAHLPTFSAVARNIGGTTYSDTSVEKIPTNVDLAVGYTTYSGKNLHLRLECIYKDFSGKVQKTRKSRYFFGGEIRLFEVLNIRGGYAQGYPSMGLGFRVKKTSVDFAWYSEERGASFQEDREQRYILQTTWDLF